jgi:MFS transporter, DHA2 family, methylenomycin A resistance protein
MSKPTSTAISNAQIAPGDEGRLKIVLTICIAMFIISFDVTVVNVALPTIKDYYTVAPTSVEWIVEAYTIPFAALMLFGGTLCDRIGPLRAFQVGVAVFGLASLVAAVAPTFLVLVFARMLQGIGAAICMPSALAVLRTYVPGESLGKAIAAWTFAGSVAISAGPIAGGIIVEYWSWRGIFAVNVPLTIYAIAATLSLATLRPAAKKKLDYAGLALYTVTGATLIVTLLTLNTGGQSRLAVLIAGAAITIVAATVLIIVERRTDVAAIPINLFTNAGFTSATVVATLLNVINFGLLFCLGLYYGGANGFSALKSGLYFLPMMLATALSTATVEKVRAKFGDRPTILAGLCIELIGAISLIPFATNPGLIAASTILLGLGVGLAIPPLTTIMLQSVTATDSGAASGVFSSFRQLGSALGVAVLGLFVSGTGERISISLGHAGVLCAGVGIVALVVYAIATRARSESL